MKIPILRWLTKTFTALSLISASAYSLVAQSIPELDEFSEGWVSAGRDPAMPYRYILPPGHSDPANASTRYPLIIFLHGNGEKGTDNRSQIFRRTTLSDGSTKWVPRVKVLNYTSAEYQAQHPSIFIAPQCGGPNYTIGSWEMDAPEAQLVALVQDFIRVYRADPDRIYITGLSMGGGGAWRLLNRNPELFAAAIPICGWSQLDAPIIRNVIAHRVNIWAAHNSGDGTVGVGTSEAAVEANWNNRGRAIFTRYNANGHDAWSATYASSKVFAWLMAQQRGIWSTVEPVQVTPSSTVPGGSSAVVSGTTTAQSGATVAEVKLRSSVNATGGFPSSGRQIVSATGTATWSGTVPLHSGVNTVTALALANSMTSSPGVTYFPAPLNLVPSGGTGDLTAPQVSFTSPAEGASTSLDYITATGVASDNIAVSYLTWSSDRGGNGTVTGTGSWSTGSISLLPGLNRITVQAYDAAGNLATATLTVNSTAQLVNKAPVVSAGGDVATTTALGVTLMGRAGDDDLPVLGRALTCGWSKVSGPGTASIYGGVYRPWVGFSSPGTYVLRFSASDGALTGTDDVTVTVTSTGTCDPIASAGLDQSISTLETVVNGFAAKDIGGGSISSTTWSKVSGPGTVTFQNGNDGDRAVTFSTGGTYVLRYTVVSGSLTAVDDVTIAVNTAPAVNQAPTVSAGVDQTISLPASATLTGSVNDDGLPIGTPLAITWSKFSGPGAVTFASPASPSTTASFSVAGNYVLRLSATDGELSHSGDVAVTVLPPNGNDAPVTNAGTAQAIRLPVNTLVLSGTVVDDGEAPGTPAPSTVWSKVSGPTLLIDSPDQLDSLVTFTIPGTYVLRLTGSDGIFTTTSEVAITVLPAVGNVVRAINCGGNAFTGSDGVEYSADQYFNAPSYAWSSTPAVAGTLDQTLYKTFRFGNNDLLYDLPIANGTYEVTLKFQEPSKTAAGQRVFNIVLEGAIAKSNLDIFAAAGASTAYDLTYPVTVADGVLNLSFPTSPPWERGLLCALVVRQPQQTSSFAAWQGQVNWNSADGAPGADPDGDGVANIIEYALGSLPTIPSQTGVPQLEHDGEYMYLTYKRDTQKVDIIYQAEATTDLVSWFHVPGELKDSTSGIETWSAKVPLNSGAMYLRLRVVH